MRELHLLYCVCGVIVLGILASTAESTLITFDTLDPTIVSVGGDGKTIRPGALTELGLTVDGVTVTITREGDGVFDLVDNTLSTQIGKPANWGAVSLDFFADTRNLGLIFSFSDPIVAFSLLSGDFGRDLDILKLFAYTSDDASGDPINSEPVESYLPLTATRQWEEKRFYIDVDEGEEGFSSVKFYGGAADFDVFVDRVFFDRSGELDPMESSLDDPGNVGDTITVIPEPGSLALIGLGLAVMFKRKKK